MGDRHDDKAREIVKQYNVEGIELDSELPELIEDFAQALREETERLTIDKMIAILKKIHLKEGLLWEPWYFEIATEIIKAIRGRE